MKRIVLIDDDDTTNYLNKLIIERSQLVDEVLSFDTAEKALDFFSHQGSQTDKALVLLDINMPIMNGWQFLDQYQAIKNGNDSNKIVILTSSINPTDKQMAEDKPVITDYKAKPLSIDMVGELVANHL
ncbi:response regulator [Ekhidna sp.]|uniref:response regulator n=1 Tax=Ekhidna sp. TaxID=2608089 RepID=UPI00329A6450